MKIPCKNILIMQLSSGLLILILHDHMAMDWLKSDMGNILLQNTGIRYFSTQKLWRGHMMEL